MEPVVANRQVANDSVKDATVLAIIRSLDVLYKAVPRMFY